MHLNCFVKLFKNRDSFDSDSKIFIYSFDLEPKQDYELYSIESMELNILNFNKIDNKIIQETKNVVQSFIKN